MVLNFNPQCGSFINLKQAKIMNLSLFSEEFQNFFKKPCKKKLLIEKPFIKNIMRIGIVTVTLLITTSVQLLFAFPAKSQPIDEVQIRVGLNNETLVQAFQKVEAQSPFHFMYRKDEVKDIRNLSLPPDKKSVEEFLKIILAKTSLTYKQVNDQILIMPVKKLISDLTLNGSEANIINGKVTDSKGNALAGVSITVKGTNTGTSTNSKGNYTISVSQSSTLVFTNVGFIAQEININGQTTVNVTLLEVPTALNEVVVTALGLSREKRGLTFAISEVKGDEFTQARENNVANGLVGKVAGVDVTGMASGPGGSSRIIIRGNGSLNGDNQPLYVINGMPMSNTHREEKPGISGTILDQGDGISAINPDDIESIDILKGGPAAALYGSQAANGVILITTKKGAVRKGIGVELNSNFTVGTPSMYPDLQYVYGQGLDGVKPTTQAEARQSGRLSFGAKIDGQPYIQFDGLMHPYSAVNVKDNFKHFYRTSTDRTNTVAFSGGNSSALVYRLSLSDLEAKALQPGSSYSRQTANLNIRSVLGKKLVVEAIIQYNLDKGKNRPGNGYADNSTSWGVNLLANTVDIRSLAPGYDENGNEVMWNEVSTAQNPYFVINKMGNADSKNRFIGQANIQYNILDNLFIKVSMMRDMDRFESMAYLPYGAARLPLGTFFSGTSFETETTGQAIIDYNFSFLKDFHLNAVAGGSLEKNVFESTSHNGSDFIVPNFISYNNLATQSSSIGFNQMGQNSLFGSADLDYKKLVYLTLTGRQDWFSVLNPGNNSIFYPSVGASFILSDALKLPSVINFAKLRASWAQVGSATVAPYQINTSYNFLAGGFLGLPVQTTSSQLSNPDLRPLTSTTYEGGLNIEFLNSRLGIDITYYNRKTTDDILPVTIAASSGYTTALLNAGALSNRGVELMLTGQPVRSGNFNWNVSYNAAYNKSEILKLAPGLTTIGGSGVGSPYNTILSTTYITNDKGQRIYNKQSGYEVKGPLISAGQGVAPYTMGLTNNFRYKNFSLNILIDGKFGNTVQSQLSRYMYRFGLSKQTLAGRENGLTVSGVDETGAPFTKTWPVNQLDTYYNNEASISPITTSIFDGSFVKLRSVILSYHIPVNKRMLKKIESINVSIVARNLAILYTKITDFDPESAYTVGNDQGNVSNTIPRTRNIGVDLIVKF
jgi:TonB-linked SusC/RagA family outer membrane protein